MTTETTRTDHPARTYESLKSHSDRGERLNPAKSSRVYCVLEGIRLALEEAIRDHLPASKSALLVDYGCGNMPYRPLFDGRVGTYCGCDFPGNDIAHRTITDPFTLPVESDRAQCVLSTQVLEHCLDPHRYLSECHRVLSDGGLLLLSTHGVWRYHPDPHDLWRWTGEGLQLEISRAGFEVLKVRGILGPTAYALQIWQDAVLRHVPRLARGAFTYLVQRLIALAERRCSSEQRNNDASVFLVVARKTGNTAGRDRSNPCPD